MCVGSAGLFLVLALRAVGSLGGGAAAGMLYLPLQRGSIDEGAAPDRSSDRRRLAVDSTPDNYPLFQGMGTHYAFLWVGTPPQVLQMS